MGLMALVLSDPKKQSRYNLSPGTNSLDSSHLLHLQAVSTAPDDSSGRNASCDAEI